MSDPAQGEDQAAIKYLVNPTAIQSVLISLGLAVAAGISISTTIAAVWKARDLSAFLNYVRGSEFLTAVAAISAGVTTLTIVIRTTIRHGQRVELARSSSIGAVRGETMAAPPIRAPEPETPPLNLVGYDRIMDPAPLPPPSK